MALAGVTSALGGLLAANPEGPNADTVSPGLLGFVTVFCLALALFVLIRSMTKRLRNVRYSPGPDGRMWTPPGTVGAPPGAAEPPSSELPSSESPSSGPPAG